MRKSGTITTAILAAFIMIGFGVQQIAAHDGATGVVKQRMDSFKASQGHLKAISQLMMMEEFDEIIDRAGKMREWGRMIPDAFPEGSGGGVSDARPEIWENFSDFSAKANDQVTALDRLIVAAEAGDPDAVEAAFKAVAGTCKACHMQYRKL